MKWPFCDTLPPPTADEGNTMEARMAAFDWAGSPLGPAAGWPASLKSAVRVLLDCRLPMYLAWGPGFTQFFNDAYLPILGAKDGGALGADARVTWSEIWPTIGPMWAQVLEGRGIGADRFKLTIDRYGYPEDCYFSFSYSPVPDDSGHPAGVLVTFAETTDAVLAERRQAFRLGLADALRGLGDPLAITDKAAAMLGEYLGAGRAGYGEIDTVRDTVSVHQDWSGGRMASLAGESRPLDSFGPNIIAELRAGRTLRLDDIGADARSAPYAAGYASIDTRSLLVVPLIKDGVLAAVLYLHCDAPRRWSEDDTAIAEEVAHRTWDAIERARAEHALVQADRRKDEFLAMLAHELRNPLAPISSAAQLLELGRFDKAGVLETGKVITRQVRHMTALLNDLLDVSRVTRGMVELDLHTVDLRTVVDTAIEQVRPLVDARRHRLRFTQPVAPVMVPGDFVRLVQVVANILNNSAKYGGEGGNIDVTLTSAQDTATLLVRDDGNGIAPDLLPHVFDLFVQGSRTLGRTQGGLGLGLALVRSLVELHKGKVQAFSAGEGRGTTISIELPCAAPAALAAAPSLQPGGQAGGTALPGLRILLVDDNEDAAAMVAMLLRGRGHEVVVAHSAGAALARSAALAPQVVILDIGLPDMDGYALIARLREAGGCAAARFIALTGYGRPEDRQRAEAAGFWRHLTKPAPAALLFSYLEECAEQAALPGHAATPAASLS